MPQVLHAIEKSIISSLRAAPRQTAQELAESAGLSPDQARRGIEWLRLKRLINVTESRTTTISLDRNGLDSLEKGLPERRLLEMLSDGSQEISVLQGAMGQSFGAAMGITRRLGLVSDAAPGKKGSHGRATKRARRTIALAGRPPARLPGEAALRAIGRGSVPAESLDQKDLKALAGRSRFVVYDVAVSRVVTLADAASKLSLAGEGSPTAGAIDVSAAVPDTQLGRTHPLKEVINEIREIFVTMGFTEISGDMVQPCFWNFDALLTPQDHPSRDMQDTFYLDGISASEVGDPEHVRRIGMTHDSVWHHKWDADEANRMVMRTHTTCVTLKYLAEHQDLDQARIFSLGRVFRNEKTSYKHLAEFTQVEGIVHERDATIMDLMGIQEEFYRRLGLTKIRFWPTFFPYTEPSFQSMVYNERLGRWVELFGMGVFHPLVTGGLQTTTPVLAWGGGVERIAMLKYGIDDVREFYANNIGWLRSARPTCQ